MCKKEAAGDQPQIELETDAIGKVGATPKTETTVPNARRCSIDESRAGGPHPKCHRA